MRTEIFLFDFFAWSEKNWSALNLFDWSKMFLFDFYFMSNSWNHISETYFLVCLNFSLVKGTREVSDKNIVHRSDYIYFPWNSPENSGLFWKIKYAWCDTDLYCGIIILKKGSLDNWEKKKSSITLAHGIKIRCSNHVTPVFWLAATVPGSDLESRQWNQL